MQSITSHYTREETVYYLENYRQLDQAGLSQRQASKRLDIPRSSLQEWLGYQKGGPWEEGRSYWESIEGLEMLKRILLATHFVFQQSGCCGIRMVCEFLELSGLSQFVASSYGSQCAYAENLGELIGQLGSEEGERLGSIMKPKQIALVQDETFHPQPCLVAMEPVSNFLLLEAYSEGRSAEDWKEGMQKALKKYPLEVLQVTGDEGSGLKAYVQQELNAFHSPDLWHQQRDLNQAIQFSLRTRFQETEKQYEAAKKLHAYWQDQKQFHEKYPARGRPLNYEIRIENACKEEEVHKQEWETRLRQQEEVHQSIQKLSAVYHLVDLENGILQSSEQIAQGLDGCMAPIQKIVNAKWLNEASLKKVKKVTKVIEKMKQTVTFVWGLIALTVKQLNLSAELEGEFYTKLFPALYLESFALKVASAEQRKQIRAQAKQLRELLKEGPFAHLTPEIQQSLEQAARQCVGYFQRSSSCVEGRNGFLRMRHHQARGFTDRQLQVLTVLHNFWIQRADGTTAAERFFERKPRNLFSLILERTLAPPRPRIRNYYVS